MNEILLLRADAGPHLGIGHVMRGLALGQAWMRRGGEVHLASSHLPALLASRLSREGLRLHDVQAEPGSVADADALARLAWEVGAPGAVIDGYVFGPGFANRFRQCGLRLMRVDDDPAALSLGADQVVNPNLYMASRRDQALPGETEFFAGPRYALLRDEFREFPPRTGHAGPLRLLVTLGGSDPTGTTDRVLRALERVSAPMDVRVVFGPAREASPPSASSRHNMALLTDVRDMATQMAWADLALAGAGVACTELARCGVPILALVQAENQVSVAAAVARLGLGWDLGFAPDESALVERIETLARDAGVRAAMAAAGPRLVDGRGANRVARAWDLGGLRLRPVRAADAEKLFVWANDPGTRAMSFSNGPIAWGVHLAWLERCLRDPGHRFFIAEDLRGTCLGQVRFQSFKESELISVGLAPESRGRDWGRRVIAKACASLPPGTTVAAYIKPENEASLRAFLKAGFGTPGPAEWEGHRALRMDFMEEDT